MPYLKKEDREYLNKVKAGSPGELNYIMTEMALTLLFRFGEPNYAEYNAVIGALECCKLEMYRRMVAPYEDKKKKENGDVYPC